MSQPADQPNWLEGLGFAITGRPPHGGGEGPGGAPPSGQGFTMTVDEARDLLAVARRARDRYEVMRFAAASILRMKPPADEPAGDTYNQRMVGEDHDSGVLGEGRDQVERAYDYANQLVRRLEQALGITESSDEQSSAEVKKAAPSEGEGFA